MGETEGPVEVAHEGVGVKGAPGGWVVGGLVEMVGCLPPTA